MCSDIREAWAINASNGLQIYAFPEGTKDESATFVNTPKMFQSVMSVWCARPSDLGSDMWLAVVEIPSKPRAGPVPFYPSHSRGVRFYLLARGSARSENSSGEQFGVASLASRAITPWIRDGSLIAAHNTHNRPHNTHNNP